MDALLRKAVAYFARPFSSWSAFSGSVLSPVAALNNPATAHAWPYLLAGLACAWLVYRFSGRPGRAGFLRFAFPAAAYGHRSARADYAFVAFDLLTKPLLVSPLVAAVSWCLYLALHRVLPSLPLRLPQSAAARGVLASLAALLVSDLGLFLSHWLMHRVKLLWLFHEVHHSAEVLTPVTVYRVHPVEALVNGLVGSVVGALVAVFYGAASGSEARFLDVYGVNVILMAFFLAGFHLRHSHVWLSFGPALSRVFISPAQHQIHHSKERKHWNKNFGYTFAFWDLLLGTLYVPKARERVEFGIPDTDPEDFATVPRLYGLPLLKAWRRLTAKAPAAAALPARPETERTLG